MPVSIAPVKASALQGSHVACLGGAEGPEFVEQLHQLPELADAALVNAGAWTHYSRAISDALAVAALPAVEVRWFDVQSKEARTATLPAETIDVLPATGSSASAAPAAAPAPAPQISMQKSPQAAPAPAAPSATALVLKL